MTYISCRDNSSFPSSILSWDSMKLAICGAIRSDTIIPKTVNKEV